MNRNIAAIILVLFCITACDQTPDALYQIERDNKYGYIDSLGTEVIPPQYVLAGHFRNGLACVVTDTVYIHKSDTLKLLSAPYILKRDTVTITYGYINTKNEFAIKPQLQLRIAQKNSFFSNLNQGDDPLSASGIRSFIDKNLFFSADGLVMFQSPNGLWGYLDKKGNIAIEPQYSEAKLFSEGKAPVRIDKRKQIGSSDEFFTIERLWGCIDIKGNTVIDLSTNLSNHFIMIGPLFS